VKNVETWAKKADIGGKANQPRLLTFCCLLYWTCILD